LLFLLGRADKAKGVLQNALKSSAGDPAAIQAALDSLNDVSLSSHKARDGMGAQCDQSHHLEEGKSFSAASTTTSSSSSRSFINDSNRSICLSEDSRDKQTHHDLDGVSELCSGFICRVHS
jgi:hypothetical protein